MGGSGINRAVPRARWMLEMGDPVRVAVEAHFPRSALGLVPPFSLLPFFPLILEVSY